MLSIQFNIFDQGYRSDRLFPMLLELLRVPLDGGITPGHPELPAATRRDSSDRVNRSVNQPYHLVDFFPRARLMAGSVAGKLIKSQETPLQTG